MKCKYCLFALLLTLVSAPAAFAEYALRVCLNDGSTQIFMIESAPVISFSGDEMIVKSQKVEFSCRLDQIDHYDFPSGIAQDALADIRKEYGIQMIGNRILLSGLPSDSRVELYSVGGVTISNTGCDSGGNADVDLNGLTPGVYIMRVGDFTTKIMVK